MTRKKNVLLLWTDQQRADTIRAYGNDEVQTPNVDRLAHTGAIFEQAYCTQPVCSPSRASVLTGVYPHNHGLTHCNMVLDTEVPTLAEILRADGYAGGYVGKWHLGFELRPQRGFDFWASTEDLYTAYDSDESEGVSTYFQFLTDRGYEPEDAGKFEYPIFGRDTAARLPEEVSKPAFMAEESIRFIDEHTDEPFFLSVNFLEPHFPFFSCYDDMYDPDDVTLPESWFEEMEDTVPRHYQLLRRKFAVDNPYVDPNDEQGWKELIARYWGMCSLVDTYCGRILDHLEQSGLADDTIVIYTSDHGDMMGQLRMVTKSVQYEGAVQVPLIVRSPGLEPQRITTPTSLVDITPTVLDLLGLPTPDHMLGASLVPVLEQGDIAPDDAEVVIEWHDWDGIKEVWDPETGVADDGEQQPASVGARTIRRGKWKLSIYATGETEIYDLESDPQETHNAIADDAAADAVADLYERLLAWQRATDDSFELVDPRPAAVH